MKKTIIVVVSLVVLLGIVGSVVISISNVSCVKSELKKYEKKLVKISHLVEGREVKQSGVINVNVNYKGAHGENYPADFIYNYELSDKLYFENETHSYMDISELEKFIRVLSKVNMIDTNNYENLSMVKGGYSITYDESTINELLGTNFKSVKAFVKTKKIMQKVEYVEITLDDIFITLNNDDIKIKYKNNAISIKLGEDAHYVNVNDKLKINIFEKENSTFSIVLNNQVYSLELMSDGANIKFNSSAAIYNSITLNVSYSDVTLNKDKEDDNFNDNPIIRYLSESDLSVWR